MAHAIDPKSTPATNLHDMIIVVSGGVVRETISEIIGDTSIFIFDWDNFNQEDDAGMVEMIRGLHKLDMADPENPAYRKLIDEAEIALWEAR